jgi:hypothetical protein
MSDGDIPLAGAYEPDACLPSSAVWRPLIAEMAAPDCRAESALPSEAVTAGESLASARVPVVSNDALVVGGAAETTAAEKSVICDAVWLCVDGGKVLGLLMSVSHELGRAAMACAVRSGVIHFSLSVPVVASVCVAFPSGRLAGVPSVPRMTLFCTSAWSVAVRVASPVTDHRISMNAGTLAGLDAKAASRGTVLRFSVPDSATARKLASEKLRLSAAVIVVPLGVATTAPFSTKTTSSGTRSRRLSTIRSSTTLLAADLTNLRFFRSIKSFMPLLAARLSNLRVA